MRMWTATTPIYASSLGCSSQAQFRAGATFVLVNRPAQDRPNVSFRRRHLFVQHEAEFEFPLMVQDYVEVTAAL